MAGTLTTEELLRRLDEQHQAYIATFRLVHETLAKTASATRIAPALQPPVSTFTETAIEIEAERPADGKPVMVRSSLLTGESDESDDDDDELYLQTPLSSYKYDLEDLRNHLKTYTWNEYGAVLLDSVVHNKRLLYPTLFPEYSEDEKWHNSHYSVFDVCTDGAPLSRREVVKAGTKSIDSAVWQAIQDLNADPDAQRPAVGRIFIVREPSPIILGALHLTMNKYFDMDEIFKYLVDEDKSNAHLLNRSFSPDERRQRSFIFEFDYFTLVGEGVQPMPWQRSDSAEKVLKKSKEHIPISRCSSVVALFLGGLPVRKLRNAARRAKTKYGFVHDPWAAWHVLNIQCYPDHKHSIDAHDSTKHYVNGPEAFLHTLLAEFKDAQKRFEDIYIKISKLVIPPVATPFCVVIAHLLCRFESVQWRFYQGCADFMFNGEMRDKLLFEDEEFTYSRRYFWAFQTLGLINDSIKAIIDAYEDTFTDDVWEGKHKSLWPMIDQDSHRNLYWRKRMSLLKKYFETEIRNMVKMYKENDDRRKEIRTLRDQLFSGTSVLESRKSVELSAVTILQGHNIKLLTLVSIFFLPLTFVTSVFGMTNMPTERDFTWFGVTMATVCIPFFLLIGSLNTTSGMTFWRGKWHQFLAWAFRSPHLLLGPQDQKPENGSALAEIRMKRRSLSAHEATHEINIRKAQIDTNGQSSASTCDSTPSTPPQIEIPGQCVNTPRTQDVPKTLHQNISPTPPAEKATAQQSKRASSWWLKITRRRRSKLGLVPNV
ncbi:hypothetical protein BUE80_DR003680 [Diplocarpon rosae]|nr:hypothetical protein BUE80_DR003680 [Diplocarpon rosae]